MNNENPRILDTIKSLIPLLPFFGAFMIMYGAISAITYYWFFSIDILSFMDFSELIVYFIKDIYSILFLILVITGGMYFLDKVGPGAGVLRDLKNRVETLQSLAKENPQEFEISKETQQAVENVKMEVKRLTRKYKRSGTVAIIFLGVMVIGLVCYSIFTKDWVYLLESTLLICVEAAILNIFFFDFKILVVVFVLSLLLATSFIGSYERVRKALNGKYFGVTLKINGQELKSDSVNFFIGKTDKYIFYYNSSEKRTTIFTSDKIESIYMPNKRAGKGLLNPAFK